jgi:hypothetical protein
MCEDAHCLGFANALQSTGGETMATETTEQHATDHALDELASWLRPGTNEGISFEMSRLTDDLFSDSFLGGGDISLFTASGRRGVMTSQLSKGHRLDSGGGVPAQFDISVAIDLNANKVTGQWAYPGEPVKTYHFQLTFLKKRPGVAGEQLLFYGENAAPDDDAGYAFSFTLL